MNFPSTTQSVAFFNRYVLALKTGFEARSSGDPTDFQRLYHQQSDICMLHLFESFMESAPQLVLQLYIMVTLETWQSWTGECYSFFPPCIVSFNLGSGRNYSLRTLTQNLHKHYQMYNVIVYIFGSCCNSSCYYCSTPRSHYNL